MHYQFDLPADDRFKFGTKKHQYNLNLFNQLRLYPIA